MHLARHVDMYLKDCKLAAAAACGHVGPKAIHTVNKDAAEKTKYTLLLDNKFPDVRSTLFSTRLDRPAARVSWHS